MESHLLQMRGLKPVKYLTLLFVKMSHLLQMRGLKQFIEICPYIDCSRIFYRCVD